MKKIPDIVKWAESPAGFYLSESRKPIRLAAHQKEILRHIFTVQEDERLPYETVVWSCPKKSGKTTIAALVAQYFALFFESPNEIFCCANSLEQSAGRVFKTLGRSVDLNKILSNRVDVQNKVIHFDNGTDVTALSSDYAGAAGSNHGLTLWDELWAYLTENARRLWDEMTPVPTRKHSMRFVSTYAGFEGESVLLLELYDLGNRGEVVPELEHIENGEGQPACRRNGRTFVYWDHELKQHPGLTISPDEYHEEQKKSLRPLAYLRLHENRFTSNESRFVTPEQWGACYAPSLQALKLDDTRRTVFGADGSTSRDLTALVGIYNNQDTKTAEVVYCHAWEPARGVLRGGRPTVDLDETIGAEVERLFSVGQLAAIYADPYQFHTLILKWEKMGIKVIEMPQTSARTEADQALYDAVIGKTITHFGDPVLTEHIRNAVAIETPRGFRLAKEKTRLKIDLSVALSMAHFGARQMVGYSPLPENQPMQKSKFLERPLPDGKSRWKRY